MLRTTTFKKEALKVVAHYGLHKRIETWIYINYWKYYNLKLIYFEIFLKILLIEPSFENKIS